MDIDNKQTAIHLLKNISVIRNKYDEISKVTGDKFNIFSILHLESDEVRLHSRLIGELLNPNGSHNQKGLYLKLFIDTLNLETTYSNDEIDNATVIVEENIGNISDDYENGGRIDLVVKFPNNAQQIVIENKIWASDQFRQLSRYKNEYPSAHIIYLTPFEKKPSEESIGETHFDVVCITYAKEIKEWIINCLKETYSLPLIREVLNQYLNLINKLTNQSTNIKMENEIIDTILGKGGNVNKEMIVAFLELKKIQLEPAILKRLIEKLKDNGKFEYVRYNSDEINSNGFEISIGNSTSNYEVKIYFHSINDAIIGVYKKDSPIYNSEKNDESNNSLIIEEQRLKLAKFNIGKLLRTDSIYVNWLWVCKFNTYNDCNWEDKLSDDFFNRIELDIMSIYQNIVK